MITAAGNTRAYCNAERENRISQSREHPCSKIGREDLVPSAPCRAVLYSLPGYGSVAMRGGLREMRGARRVERGRCGCRTRGAVCARCRRGPRFVYTVKIAYTKLITNDNNTFMYNIYMFVTYRHTPIPPRIPQREFRLCHQNPFGQCLSTGFDLFHY